MTSISNLASHTFITQRILSTQNLLYDYEIQAASGKVSQDYSGIARYSQRLISLENLRDTADRHVDNSDILMLRMRGTNDVIDAVDSSLRLFRSEITQTMAQNVNDENVTKNIQQLAFQTLIDLEGYLNTEIDGEYLFAGSKVYTKPVEFNLTDLTYFQTTWDGETTTYPTTEANHIRQRLSATSGFPDPTKTIGDPGTLDYGPAPGTYPANSGVITAANAGAFENVEIGDFVTFTDSADADGNTVAGDYDGVYQVIDIPIDGQIVVANWPAALAAQAGDATAQIQMGGYGTLDYGPAGGGPAAASGEIHAAVPGAFGNIVAGMTITVSGSVDGDGDGVGDADGPYEVLSRNSDPSGGDTLYLDGWPAADPSGSLNQDMTIAVDHFYYHGDNNLLTHRVDEHRTVQADATALHPGFEKAIQALSIIAQGKYGTDGGLDNHSERLDEALYLVSSAIREPLASTKPASIGTLDRDNLRDLAVAHGRDWAFINDTRDWLERYSGVLTSEIEGIEDADQTTVVTNLMMATNALEASYKAFSIVQTLSLTQYI